MSQERRPAGTRDVEDRRASTPGAGRRAVTPRSVATLAVGPGTSPVVRVAEPDARLAPNVAAAPTSRLDAGPDVGLAAAPLVDAPYAEPTFVRTRLVRDTALLLFGGAVLVIAMVVVAPPRPGGAVLSATGRPGGPPTLDLPAAAEPVTTSTPTPVPSATRTTASSSPSPSGGASGRPASPRP